MKCRHCHTELELLMADLGSAPPSNAYLTKKALQARYADETNWRQATQEVFHA